jgi:phage head maturation protease
MDWSAEARFAQGAELGQSTGRAVDRVPQPSGAARRDGRLRVLVEVKLWEVSLVTFPMLPGARFGVVSGSGDRIETVKSS